MQPISLASPRGIILHIASSDSSGTMVLIHSFSSSIRDNTRNGDPWGEERRKILNAKGWVVAG